MFCGTSNVRGKGRPIRTATLVRSYAMFSNVCSKGRSIKCNTGIVPILVCDTISTDSEGNG